jgi:long-subunit fatty acid transport protein
MQNKASRLFIFLLVTSLLVGHVNAQNLTQSPYSIIGIGEMQYYGSATQSSMGQVAQGMRKSADVNVYNAASFSALKYTVIDGGVMFSPGTISKGRFQSSVENYSFSYFWIGMPISIKRSIGMVFGLSPYSSLGYNVSTPNQYPDFTAVTEMKGTGGLSRFHFGLGAKLFKNLSIGFNANYIFGQTTLEQKLIIPKQFNQSNIAETRRRVVRDMQYQFGAQYHKDIIKGIRKDKYTLVVGSNYTLATNLKAKEDQFVRSLGVGGTGYFGDTQYYKNDVEGFIRMPYTVSSGISYEKKDHWFVNTDVNYTNWSSYREFGRVTSLTNSLGVSVGGSFIPNILDYKNYFKRIEYRAGLRYDNGNIILSDTRISTYGLSVGMGMPLGKSKSRINLSAEYFVKGTTDNNLIKEEYFRFILGLNFSDKWFQRYKYD